MTAFFWATLASSIHCVAIGVAVFLSGLGGYLMGLLLATWMVHCERKHQRQMEILDKELEIARCSQEGLPPIDWESDGTGNSGNDDALPPLEHIGDGNEPEIDPRCGLLDGEEDAEGDSQLCE